MPGADAARWLDEISRCGLGLADTRLFLVPRSTRELATAGVLVIPPRDARASGAPAGLACKFCGERLIIPCDAELYPPLTGAELRQLCLFPIVFFHPTLGVSGFDEESTLHLWDLLEMPGERHTQWNRAQAGAQPLPALASVALLQPPVFEQLFGGASSEIGTAPPTDLPPAPYEPKENALGKTMRGLKGAMAKTIADLLARVPHTGTRRTWVNDAEDWAQKQLSGVSSDLDQLRHKELHRLLHMLDADPEAGLKHAIPMNDFAARGTAPPGAHLGTHGTEFNVSRLGGGPADYWNVPDALQQTLRQKYREMADRELQLGRHRRAAYIYAELLGDLGSAAAAMVSGKFYREAAVLYEEHLRSPLEAARCLADGGLLAEAAERYEKLERWIEAADLHERLENKPAAQAALRRAVDARLSQNDRLGAARLLEERLRAPDEALMVLRAGWPDSQQAVACLSALMDFFSRHGRHEDALNQVSDLKQGFPSRLTLPVLSSLCGVAQAYPDTRVKYRSADLARILIARALARPELRADEAAQFAQHLVRLAPDDRLLARDANRHLAARRSVELKVRSLRPPPPSAGSGGKFELSRRFQLPQQINWIDLRSEWHWFYALGSTPNHVTMARGVWEGEIQSLSWPCTVTALKNGYHFEPTHQRGTAVALVCTVTGFRSRRFPAADLFFNQECIAGTPEGFGPYMFPLAFAAEAVWSLHVAASTAVLSCFNKRGHLQRTVELTRELIEGAERSESSRVCLSAFEGGVAVGLGTRLVIVRGEHVLTRLDLPGEVVRLTPTLPHTRQGIAAMLDHGAMLHWVGTDSVIELDRDIASPLATFVPGGPMVLVSKRSLLLLSVDSRGVQGVTRAELNERNIIGLTATSSPGQFAVLNSTGEMGIYRTG